MKPIDRRSGLLLAAAALSVAAAPVDGGTSAGSASHVYDYVLVDVAPTPGTPSRNALGELASAARAKLAGTSGSLLAAFTPQLGWTSNQGALLLGWPSHDAARRAVLTSLASASSVARSVPDVLSPTLRPTRIAPPPGGGIYVHRWFAIAPSDLDAFLQLSSVGWDDFEVRFDSQIYGLFKAAQTPQDLAAGEMRLLLITRYGDHGVWEKSRDPSTAAMAAFGERQRITRRTWGASTLLLPQTV